MKRILFAVVALALSAISASAETPNLGGGYYLPKGSCPSCQPRYIYQSCPSCQQPAQPIPVAGPSQSIVVAVPTENVTYVAVRASRLETYYTFFGRRTRVVYYTRYIPVAQAIPAVIVPQPATVVVPPAVAVPVIPAPTVVPVAPVPVVPVPAVPPKYTIPPGKLKPTSTGSPSQFAVEVKWWRSGIAEGRRQLLAQVGSGTVVRAGNGKSLVVTNRHVAAEPDGNDYQPHPKEHHEILRTGDGEPIMARLVAKADVGDLCLVECDAELPVAPMAENVPAAGEHVRQWGFSHLRMNLKEGVMLKAAKLPTDSAYGNAPNVSSTIAIEQGDSGSGVFNDKGELCAVSHQQSGYSGADHVPIQLVRDLLKKYDARAAK